MTKKKKSVFSCQNCGCQRPRWEGRCPECGAWNSFVEESFTPVSQVHEDRQSWVGDTAVVSLDQTMEQVDIPRDSTGITELDRTLGGGLARGSFVLVGGPPGIGKSTLLLQLSGGLANRGRKVLYVSGEESVQQTSGRAHRLGVRSPLITVASEANLNQIKAQIEKLDPEVVVIDSIQTLFLPELESAPGSVSQVRESAGRLLQMSKTQGRSVILVGHVTKDGSLAGPKVLEHMVDCVLSFEGDDQLSVRMLRTLKNRFGPAQELGVFRMSSQGLQEVGNPSELFLQERNGNQTGSVVFASMEGTRPLLCEVQALCVESFQAMPRRTSLGVEVNRLHMLAAVLDRHLGMSFGRHDIFINVVGGLKLVDPAVDVAIAAALLSSSADQAVRRQGMFLGEIGLTGEVRSVSQLEVRLKEGLKLGFDEFYLPDYQKKLAQEILGDKARLIPLRTLDDLRKSLIIKKGSSSRAQASSVGATTTTGPDQGSATGMGLKGERQEKKHAASEDRPKARAPEFEGG